MISSIKIKKEMPSKTDGISPQNKIDNNVSTAINTVVIFYI